MSQNIEKPLVSAIIPTHCRPDLVCRAVRGVLNQTYINLEVIVVVDGPEPRTVGQLKSLSEQRLRVIELQETVRGSEARNIGVREARGEWVAFLDDDDEWLPEKIAKQVSLLARDVHGTNFISCRIEQRFVGNSSTLPHDFPHPEENWSEYIYCRGGLLLPSTYLVKREVMLAVPFAKGLSSNEDSDWLLRAHAQEALVPAWLDEKLAVYHCEDDQKRVSTNANWRGPLRWALDNRKTLLTRRAFSYCIVRLCIPRIRADRMPIRNSLRLLYTAIVKGAIDYRFCNMFFLYMIRFVLLSDDVRLRFKALAGKLRMKSAYSAVSGMFSNSQMR
jgi:glycosyltransferase involved in cell wall biosynthesis